MAPVAGTVRGAVLNGAVSNGDVRRTGVELDQLADRIAASLAEQIADGAGRGGCRVAVATADRADCLAAVVGCWRSGLVPVPISEQAPIAGSIEDERFQTRLDIAQPVAVLGDEAHSELLAVAGYVPDTQPVGNLRTWRPSSRPSVPCPAGTALILFTSGSTGLPKAVVIPERAVAAAAATNAGLYGMTGDDRFLSTLPMTHMAGLTNLLAASAAGADIVIAPQGLLPADLRRLVADQEISVLGTVPHQLFQLLGTSDPSGLATLRIVVSSGAQLSGPVIERTERALPAVTLYNAYGLTEAFRSFVTVARADDPCDLGLPAAGVEARLIDPETGERCEDGQVGEIQLRGANLYSGYWTGDCLDPATDWLATGDMAAVNPDGGFRLVGRQASYINIGGHKEAVETIEAVLNGAAPGRLAAIGRSDEHGLEQVVAVAERGAGIGLRDLRRRCARRIAPALRPSALIEVDQLPRTSLGKLDRAALAQLAQITQTAPQPKEIGQ